MPTGTDLRPVRTIGPSQPEPEQELVEHVVAHAITIAMDPTMDVRSGAAELARLARHDQSVIGHAWLKVVLPALRRPSRQLIVAEKLLSAALESEGDRHERVLAVVAG